MNNLFGKKNLKDIIRVIFSNGLSMLSGILVAFLLPKMIGVTDYGYYKTFTLYATYVGLFHFGIEDGIYLVFGGNSYEELNKKDFRFYTRFLLILELIISLLLFFFVLSYLDGINKVIFSCVAIYLFTSNMTNYYQFISQITGRFKEYSLRNIIKSVLTVLSLLILFLFGNNIGYREYLYIFLAINMALLIWYFYTYKEITIGTVEGNRKKYLEILKFLKLGFPLMVSNLCSALILNIDRQFINVFFENQQYALYAFAYNILTLITVFTSAVAAVFYPLLKQKDEHTAISLYSIFTSIILVVLFISMTSYFFICFVVNKFLPDFKESLLILRIIFPGVIVSSAITVSFGTFYKIVGKTFVFFINNIFIFILSIATNTIAYYTTRSMEAISIASIITIFIWYILSDYYFIKKYKTKWCKNLFYSLLCSIIFYIITMINNMLTAGILYFIFSIIITVLFFNKEIKKIFRKAFKNEKSTKTNV